MSEISKGKMDADSHNFEPGEPDNKPKNIEMTSIDSRFEKTEAPDGRIVWKLKKSEGENDNEFSMRTLLESPNRKTLKDNGFLPFEENKSVDSNRPTPFSDYNHTWDHTVSGTGNGPQYWSNKPNYFGSL